VIIKNKRYLQFTFWVNSIVLGTLETNISKRASLIKTIYIDRRVTLNLDVPDNTIFWEGRVLEAIQIKRDTFLAHLKPLPVWHIVQKCIICQKMSFGFSDTVALATHKIGYYTIWWPIYYTYSIVLKHRFLRKIVCFQAFLRQIVCFCPLWKKVYGRPCELFEWPIMYYHHNTTFSRKRLPFFFWDSLICLNQWFSTGVTQNPWVPRKSLWVSPVSDIDRYLLVNCS